MAEKLWIIRTDIFVIKSRHGGDVPRGRKNGRGLAAAKLAHDGRSGNTEAESREQRNGSADINCIAE